MTEKDIFTRAEVHLKNELPFVLYRKPVKNNVEEFILQGIFQSDSQLHFTEDFTESGFVMAAFDLTAHQSVLIPLEKSEIINQQIKNFPKEHDDNRLSHSVSQNDQKQEHIDLVNRGIKNIKEGNLQKVVLSRKLKVNFPVEILEVYKNLLHTYPSAFAYCWYHPKVGLWMGATPETLVKIENDELSTMALASTQAVNGNSAPVWTQKEIDEHQYVIDFIKDILKENVEDLKIGKVGNIQAGKLWHLKCDITGKLKSTDKIKEVLYDIHPTPAVCGMPKLASKNFIIKEEHYDREFYTGFLGELNLPDQKLHSVVITELFVNLRCMKITSQGSEIFVGGGIVKDSDPESEWLETVNKSKTMLDILKN